MSTLPDFSLLQSFVTVAQELNFRRSAERLALDQSALSRRIQRLEAQLGYPLLERTTREVLLTQAGQNFYNSALHLLDDYVQSINDSRRIAEGRSGHVRVGYMAFAATELMPHAVARFEQRHPDISLALRYMRTQGQKIAIANDEIDVGFMIGPYDNSDCHSVLLSSELLYVVTPRSHPLLRKSHIEPDDLQNVPLILGDMAEWGEFRYRLADLFSRSGIDLTPTLEASNTLALIGLVSAGLGVTIYPESLIGFLGRTVETRPIIHPDYRSRTVLAWKRNNRSRAVLHFVETAKKQGTRR
ncbi:LysR family transcriptional regulator [Primorskyibacter flagellatus]|uniref:DNA-binding transcriptional regulator, LysR family n=1 Tax=Primorskyibacter flagellatus TaxID=1387277 RepID=A0A1W2EJ72_9RHOB|nr:LysR family transcriptional regulator [Primorskyibacter flagellatus]SMD09757.1 DNA-binding transcriptional regulator, LysR family [Primorskyibacter flagellatus]